ncbi:MAG TPA: DUF2933 domain-containing protein [Dongiaceae bacterium]|jgi:fatty acid desaturase|nr:DUF2933 domain-containing protein [Dongiaceae bacterium]
MEIANRPATVPAEAGSSCPAATQDSPSGRRRRRSLVIAAALAAAGVALALWQHWLTLAELTPLLFTLPCAVMMFMCMKDMNHGQSSDTAQAPASRETPPADGRS